MRKKLTLAILVISLFNQSIAQKGPEFITEELVIPSKVLNEDRMLTVYRPKNIDGPLSIIYLLDGEWNFEVTKGILDLFIRWSRIPNEVALVSIHNQGKRTLDLTPIEDDSRFPGSGKAALFLEFFEHELVSYIEQQIGRSSDRLLIGHSFGGLFALYVLNERPDLLDGVIAISPSTWYGNNYLMNESFSKNISTLDSNKYLFISTGEFDRGNLASNKEYFDWLKKNNNKLDPYYVKYEGRNHFTNVLTSTDEGISRYFPGPQLEPQLMSSYDIGGLAQLQLWYEEQVSRFGQRLVPPSGSILSLVNKLNKKGSVHEAIQLLNWFIGYDINNGNLHYYLGALNFKAGKNKEAKAYFETALSKNLPERTKIIIKRNLEKIK